MTSEQLTREKVLDQLLEEMKTVNRNIMPRWQQYTIQGIVIFLLLCSLYLLVYTVANPNKDFTFNFLSILYER